MLKPKSMCDIKSQKSHEKCNFEFSVSKEISYKIISLEHSKQFQKIFK